MALAADSHLAAAHVALAAAAAELFPLTPAHRIAMEMEDVVCAFALDSGPQENQDGDNWNQPWSVQTLSGSSPCPGFKLGRAEERKNRRKIARDLKRASNFWAEQHASLVQAPTLDVLTGMASSILTELDAAVEAMDILLTSSKQVSPVSEAIAVVEDPVETSIKCERLKKYEFERAKDLKRKTLQRASQRRAGHSDKKGGRPVGSQPKWAIAEAKLPAVPAEEEPKEWEEEDGSMLPSQRPHVTLSINLVFYFHELWVINLVFYFHELDASPEDLFAPFVPLVHRDHFSHLART